MKPSAQTRTQNSLLVYSPPTSWASLNPSSGHNLDSKGALGNSNKITFLSLWMMPKGWQSGKKVAPLLLLINKQNIQWSPWTCSESQRRKPCDIFWGQDMRNPLMCNHPGWKPVSRGPGRNISLSNPHLLFPLGVLPSSVPANTSNCSARHKEVPVRVQTSF